MNVSQYLEQRKKRLAPTSRLRIPCEKCLQPKNWCYCANVESFDCGITFVILLHPLERRRRIASGRMSHLMLSGSYIAHGHTYSDDRKINELIHDPKYFPVILHLDHTSKNLNGLSDQEKKNICPAGKRLLVFVVDGTWATASKTVRLSKNLNALPRVSFTPDKPSAFKVRRQPKQMCYSTLEAIHQTIELLGDSQGFETQSRKHDRLLKVFDEFVLKQFNYLKNLRETGEVVKYRRYRKSA